MASSRIDMQPPYIRPLGALFLVFILTIPFSVRTTVVSFPIQGTSNPFLSFFLYHLDILAFLLVLGGLMFHVKHTNSPSSQTYAILISLALFLFGWTLLSLFHTEFPRLAWLSLTRFTMGGLLIYTLTPIIREYWFTISNALLFGAAGSVCIASLQVIGQDDLGWQFFSEARLDPNTAGVAKTQLGDSELIRGYGLFPHPNILAFFLFTSLSSLFLRYVPRGTKQKFGVGIILFAILGVGAVDHYLLTSAQGFYTGIVLILLLANQPPAPYKPLSPRVFWGVLVILTIGVILTFSHAVWPFFAILLLLTARVRTRLFHVEHQEESLSLSKFRPPVYGSAGILLGLLAFFIPWQDTATDKRLLYLERGWDIIRDNPLWGTGLHQYVNALPPGLPAWQYEPVHNIWMLATAELGLIGGALCIALTVTGMITLWKRL